MTQQHSAWLFAALAIACWATVATAFKLTLVHIDFLSLVFWSSLFSAASLALIALFTQRLRTFRDWAWRDVVVSGGLGGLNPAIYYLLLFKAYELLPAQQAQVLNFIWPLILTLLSVLIYKERVSRTAWFALIISFFGVGLIATRGQLGAVASADWLGVGLALSSALFWAIYWLVSRHDQRDPVLRLMCNFLFGSLWIALLITAQGRWLSPSAEGLMGALYIALFEMSLAFFFWLSALKAARSTAQLSNLIFVTPFLSLMVIALVLGERIELATVVGLLLIIGGILIQRMGRKLV